MINLLRPFSARVYLGLIILLLAAPVIFSLTQQSF